MLSRLPQRVGRKHAAHELAGAQLAGTHRLRQDELIQTLGQQLSESAGFSRRRGEPQHAARRRRLTVLQQALELHDAALPRLQEFPQLPQQRFESFENGRVTFHLVGEVTLAMEALAGTKSLAKIRIAARQPIQHRKLFRTETPRESGAR
jgi:hypothetical protein